jgi:guanylate kinase
MYVSVSATTRPPRDSERDGVDYHFRTVEEFDAARAGNMFLETAQVFSKHWYGTPRQPVDDALRSGRDVLLELDVQGARRVKQAMPEAITVFIEPPSWAVLEKRLRSRGTERPEAIERRLSTAKSELEAAGEFDFQVVNDDLERAIAQVDGILMGTHEADPPL